MNPRSTAAWRTDPRLRRTRTIDLRTGDPEEKRAEQRLNPSYEALVAVGVDEMSGDDLDKKNYDWPQVHDVQAYRDNMRTVLDAGVDTMPLPMPITWDSPWWVVMMGIEHARIHLETSSVLIRQLPSTP
jgi:hypothetical protein